MIRSVYFRDGFSLVELLAAIAILASLIIVIYSIFIWGQGKTELTVDMLKAENYALNLREYFISKTYADLTGNPVIAIPPCLEKSESSRFTVEHEIIERDPEDNKHFQLKINFKKDNPPVDPVNINYLIAKIKVNWKHQNRDRSFMLLETFLDK